MNDKIPENRIKDTIGNVAVAQTIIDLAKKEGAALNAIAALLENTIHANQIIQWLLNRINLNDVATLLGQRIESPVITQLINNQADLGDIATNSQHLLDRGIKVDLINGWLKNGTHLNNAIAIMYQGIDLNLIGTRGKKVGDFINLIGATPNEIVSRIPVYAKIEHWIPEPGRIEKGMEFSWKDASRKNWIVRMHESDPRAPAGSHAATGWVLRVRCGKKFMDAAGKLYTGNALTKPTSSKYDPDGANKTHIPIQAPSGK